MASTASVFPSLLLVLTLLAGCAETSDDVETSQGVAPIEVNSTTGGLRGLVVDAAIVPLEGAVVRVFPSERETTTDKDGLFVVEALQPGTYWVRAIYGGFFDGQVKTVAAAGDSEPELLRIQMVPNPDGGPFAQLYTWSGFLQCAVGLGALGTYNPCFMTGSDNLHIYSFPKTPDFLQVEMVWTPSGGPVGDDLMVGFLEDGTATHWVEAVGPSPLIFNVGKLELMEHEGETPDNVTLRVFASDQPTFTAVVQQDFDTYVTAFYGFKPFDRWTFLADGECDRPDVCGAGR